MAVTVPRYDRQRETMLAPNQLPSVRLTAAPTADQLGANARLPTDHIGAGLAAGGKAFMRVALERQAREDADVIFQREALLHDRLRAKTSEWESRRGMAAWNVVKDAETWWAEEAVKFADGLNDRQRAVFDKTLGRLRGHTLDRLSRFEAEQRRESLDASANASIVGAVNFAAANADNYEAINAARADIAERIRVRAQLNGWAPERTELELGSKLTLLHEQALQTLLARDPALAEKYLKTYREEIDGAKRAEIEKAVEGGTRLRKAQEFADQYDPAAGADESEAIRAAREKLDGEDEKITVAEIRARFLEYRQARENAQRDALDSAYEEMGPTGTVARISPATWARLGGDQQRRLIEQDAARLDREQRRIDASERRLDRKERERIREEEKRSVELWDDYMEEIREPRRSADDIARAVREDYKAGRLTRAHAQDILRSLDRNADKVEIVNPTAFNTATAVVAAQKGWTKTKAAHFKDVAKQTILAEQQLKGRPLTTEEMRSIVDALMIEGTVEKDWWFDSSKRRFEVLGTDDEARWSPKQKAKPAAAVGAGSVPGARTVVRTGVNKATGKRVVQYSDGTIEEIEQ